MFGILIQDFRDALALLILFGLTIFVHELGHFLTARWCGMVIDTFSIGFGPALWKKKIGGTEYKIGIIPCGGYVALPQLDPAGMSNVQGAAKEAGGRERDLPPVSAWKRILVSVSGAAGNMVLAVVLAWAVYAGSSPIEQGAVVGLVETNSVAYAQGIRMGDRILAVNGQEVSSWYEYGVECILGAGGDEVVLGLRSGQNERAVRIPTTEIEKSAQGVKGLWRAVPPLLGEVQPGSPAEAAGLEPLDVVREYDGVAISGWEQFRELVAERGEGEFPIVVERRGRRVASAVRPRHDGELERIAIGVKLGLMPGVPWMQKTAPFDQIAYDTTGIIRILRALLTPREARQAAGALGGPVAIIVMLWGSIKMSYIYALGFLRFLNVNLAVLNLLPIPVLDGGDVLFALWEAVMKRKVHARVVTVLINVFVVLLIGVMLLLTYRDVLGLAPRFRKPAPARVESGTPAAAVEAGAASNAPAGEAAE